MGPGGGGRDPALFDALTTRHFLIFPVETCSKQLLLVYRDQYVHTGPNRSVVHVLVPQYRRVPRLQMALNSVV